jgi:hypothetical protein
MLNLKFNARDPTTEPFFKTKKAYRHFYIGASTIMKVAVVLAINFSSQ